jgi:hypothetical protein
MDLSDLLKNLPGFDPMAFFEWMPRIALAGLAVVVALAVWMVWRSVSPAAPGISLGYYEVLGRYAGGKLVERIKGNLVEATALFLNPEVEDELKEMILEEADLFLKRETDGEAKAELASARDRFAECRLSEACRVLVTREKLFTKHVIVQYGHVDKPLNAYAAHEEGSKFSFGMGFLSQGVIGGVIHTMNQPWNIHNLGKVTVHLFRPDDPEGGGDSDQPPEYLAKIALFAPASVELKDLVKSKDEQLKEKDRKLSEMGRDLSSMATERDGLRQAVKGFSTTGEIPETMARRFDVMDFIAVSVPVLVGYYVADYSRTQPLIGVFSGLLLGAFLMYRRR